MAFSKPPAWISDHIGMENVLQHHLYLPNDINSFLNLPDITLFSQGARQFFFWRGDMAPTLPKNTVVLAFLGSEGLKRPNVLNVMKALAKITDISSLIEVHQGANSSFIGMSFSDSSIVSTIIHNFLYFDDSIVSHITHASSNTHPFRLLWLPPLFNQDRVHHLLSSITGSYNIRRESIKTSDYGFTPTNILRGTLTPKPGKSINDLPHLLSLPSPHKGSALLIITGRDPICLKCREIGHLRKDCTMRKCSSCNKVHFPSSSCGTSSYSSVASRNITRIDDSEWLSHASDIHNASNNDSSSLTNTDSNITSAITESLNNNNTSAQEFHIPGFSSPHATLEQAQGIVFPPSENYINNLPSSECGHTVLQPPSKCTSLTENPITFTSVSHNLDPDTTNNITLSDSHMQPHHSRIPIVKSPSVREPILSPTINDISLPPLSNTKSKLSNIKRIKSHLPSTASGLRSEIITYTRHSFSQKGASSSATTLHPSSFDPFPPPSDIFSDSDSSSEHDLPSDVSAEFISHQDISDQPSNRKRKNSQSPTLHNLSQSSLNSSDYTPETNEPSSKASTSSQDNLNIPIPDPLNTTPDTSQPSLSASDTNIASKLNLSPSDLLNLKLQCPGQEFSALTVRKLKLLMAYSIPVLQAASHPQFFNLSTSAITNRLKTLASHKTSVIDITDLFGTSTRYERMAGYNLPQYTLPTTPANPLLTKNAYIILEQ